VRRFIEISPRVFPGDNSGTVAIPGRESSVPRPFIARFRGYQACSERPHALLPRPQGAISGRLIDVTLTEIADPRRELAPSRAASADPADWEELNVRIHRLLDQPIISPKLHPSIGVNIQGPSMIRVPDWIDRPLGRYYLYFADHKGSYIRLAYADQPTGPWAIHAPGSLHLAQSRFLTEPPIATPDQVARYEAQLRQRGTVISHDALSEITTPHIASPDVHVDPVNRRIVMYFHGLEDVATQVSRVAISRDGIGFAAQPEVLGPSYLRVFPHNGMTYALAMPGRVHRSQDRLHGFEPGPMLFNPTMRHSAVLKRGNELLVFWTQVGEAPERILLSRIDLAGD
jgi:hypothetical protein